MAIPPIRKINRLSQLFQPINLITQKTKKDTTWNSYNHMIQYGIIKSVGIGMYALLPLGLRVLNKLSALVDNEMERIGAQKLLLPALSDSNLWIKTGRYESNKSELFTLQDRHKKDYILCPTYEETICSIIASLGIISTKMLPLKLYQISNKWRDERRPRLGFLRSREFVMKDLYTFDTTLDSAKETYEVMCQAYDNILTKINVPFVKAVGDTGSIGGLMSHEYHYISKIGEDTVCICPSCQYQVNKVLCSDSHCPKCKTVFSEHNAAEIGHGFLLDTKYSKPLKAMYSAGNTSLPLVMNCFGLGLSRMMIVLSDILSTDKELRWPSILAPYTVCIIPPKDGSKEASASQYLDKIIEVMHQLNIDAILDDRTDLTIGYRLINARATGYPYVVVIGKKAMDATPMFEIHDINGSKYCEVTLENIHSYFNNACTTS